MPCYSIQTTKVAIGRVNLERLAEVAKAEGWLSIATPGRLVLLKETTRVVVTAGQAEATVTGQPKLLLALKRAYAASTVAEAARRHGWKLKSQDTQGTTIKLKIGR